MYFNFYNSKEDISKQINSISLSIENLLETSKLKEILVCSEGFSENRARSGISVPTMILSKEGNFIEQYGMKRFDIERKRFYQTCGASFFIDDIKDENSRVIYTEKSKRIISGDWNYKDNILIVPGNFLTDNEEEISQYCSDMNIMVNCILRTSIVQRVFTTGQVYYTKSKSIEFIKKLKEI